MTPSPSSRKSRSFRPFLTLYIMAMMALSCSRKEPDALPTPPFTSSPSAQTTGPLLEPSPRGPSPLDRTSPDLSPSALDPWDLTHPDPRLDLPALMPRPRSWRRGVSLGLFASTTSVAEQRAIYTELLDEIVAVGATDLSLVVRWSQQDILSHVIEPTPDVTIPDELVQDVIREAHKRGLRTFLLPIIWLEQRQMGVWRGTLTPSDVESWWTHYARFIHHYAALAEQEGVALLSVGSELLSMETEEARWRALIASTRARYKGELTYSANWDHFEVPAFWDALDVVGMTAYQELTRAPNPTVAELEQGWTTFHMRLRRWAAEHDYRYIFTEIGYPSHREGAAYPWNYMADAPAAPWLQARCYRAMMQQWEADKRLDGLYLWNWFGFKGVEDKGYTPRGKPSAQIVEHWYKNSLDTP